MLAKHVFYFEKNIPSANAKKVRYHKVNSSIHRKTHTFKETVKYSYIL